MKKNRALVALAITLSFAAASTTIHAAGISGQGTWESTLLGRDLDGNLSTAEAYYDTSLNITWLSNANYANTTMDWATAHTWAAGLNPYGSGINGWRLPTMIDTGNPGCDQDVYVGGDCGYNVDPATGEMAHMFYITLDNTPFLDINLGYDPPGWGLANTGPFSNIPNDGHAQWYDALDVTDPSLDTAWEFRMDAGSQSPSWVGWDEYAWAVHSGDVGSAVVPVPAAVWLLGSGLLGLVGVARRKAA